MSRPEIELKMAERHVREGAERIAGQQALVRRLEAQGRSSMIYDAVVFLQTLQAEQREQIAHLERLRQSGCD